MLALLRQPKHGLGEIGAAGRIDPTRPEDQVLRATRYRLFALQFCPAIHVERAGRVGFLPELAAAAVKNVVRRIVYEPSAELLRLVSQHAGRQCVDKARLFRFGFGLVDHGIGRRIDDDVRLDLEHRFGQTSQIGKITAQPGVAGRTERHQFAQWRQAALQLPANLSVLAEKQDFHQAFLP